MAKQIIRFDSDGFSRILKEAVKESLRRRLDEDWDDGTTGYDDDNLDDYTSELLGSMERKDRAERKKMAAAENKPEDAAFLSSLEDMDAGSLFGGGNEFGGDEEEENDVQPDTSQNGSTLYNKALEALETSNGTITFNEWLEELGDEVDASEAKAAFDSAKKEMDSFDTDEVPDFANRDNKVSDTPIQKQEHQAGNVLEYDGVKIEDDGTQFTMVAKEDSPNITIKGSDLEKVKSTYDRLWNNFSNMEDVARKMGLTVYHGAWLWANDYDKFVRAAGGHEEGLPIIVDLDKLEARNKPASAPNNQEASEGNASWLAPYRHQNGKYMMTPFQVSRLSDEQRAEWEKLTKMFPNKYVKYSEALGKKGKQNK